MLILTISKRWNTWFDRSRLRVRTLGKHNPIQMFDITNVGIIPSLCICNSRGGRLLSQRAVWDSSKQ